MSEISAQIEARVRPLEKDVFRLTKQICMLEAEVESLKKAHNELVHISEFKEKKNMQKINIRKKC